MFEDLKPLTIYTKFHLGDVVYLKICSDPIKGMVTGMNIRPSGHCFLVTWEIGGESIHYEMELTKEFIDEDDFGTGDPNVFSDHD